MKHTRTDPACIEHREPQGLISRWRYELGRGKACRACDHARMLRAFVRELDEGREAIKRRRKGKE